MGYITYDDFTFRFAPELVNLSSGDISSTTDPLILQDIENVVKKIIDDASSEMELDLSIRYDIDVLRLSKHKDLKRICANITIHYLFVRKGILKYEKLYNAAKADLYDIGAGKKRLYGICYKKDFLKSNVVSYIFDDEKFTNPNMAAWEDV